MTFGRKKNTSLQKAHLATAAVSLADFSLAAFRHILPCASSSLSPSKSVAMVQEQITANFRRDLQLWMAVICVVLALTGGLAAVLVPSIIWNDSTFRSAPSDLRELVGSLVFLLALFCFYVAAQKRKLGAVRAALVREFFDNQQLSASAFLDPATQLLSAGAVSPVANAEVARANRLGSALTFVMIKLREPSKGLRLSPQYDEDHVLFRAAQTLKSTFRGSDVLFRTGDYEFLVIMPETTEQQADMAVNRLKTNVDLWNTENDFAFELFFFAAVSQHIIGARPVDTIERARRRIFVNANNMRFIL